MNKSYYAIIPANVRYDKRLTANAKLLYGEITALCNEKGYCWARNNYFAELYGVSKKSVSIWIKQLIDCGYIFSEIKYRNESKEIETRFLKIINIPITEDCTPMEENVKGYGRKLQDPIEENVKDNNTSINNTNNNKVSKKEKAVNKKVPSFDEIIDSYTDNEDLRFELKEHLKTRKAKRATLSNRAIELSLKKLDEIGDNDTQKIKIVQNAIMNGWTSFYPLRDESKSNPKKENPYENYKIGIHV